MLYHAKKTIGSFFYAIALFVTLLPGVAQTQTQTLGTQRCHCRLDQCSAAFAVGSSASCYSAGIHFGKATHKSLGAKPVSTFRS
jgi:hypothetical protein